MSATTFKITINSNILVDDSKTLEIAVPGAALQSDTPVGIAPSSNPPSDALHTVVQTYKVDTTAAQYQMLKKSGPYLTVLMPGADPATFTIWAHDNVADPVPGSWTPVPLDASSTSGKLVASLTYLSPLGKGTSCFVTVCKPTK